MKIAYVAISLSPENERGGVGVKMNSQVKTWREMGHEARVFSLTREGSPFQDWVEIKVPPIKDEGIFRIPHRELTISFVLASLIKAVQGYQPDILFFRHYRYYLGLERLLRIAPTVIELNTNDLTELGLSKSLQGPYNRLTRGVLFRRAAGFNPVSHEIANLPENHRYRLPTLTLGNGIDLEKYPPLPAPANSRPRFAMVSSDVLSWHGVDKVISFFRKFPDLSLDLVGYNSLEQSIKLPENVHFHGYLNTEGIREILAISDVAFGTMALHRKEMKEASPLKVREALAFGIPVVIAYEDTDLMGLELDTILRIPNTEDNLETYSEAVRDFAYRMRGRRVPREQIADRIDWREKEARRLEFFEQILTSRKDRRGGKTG